MSGVGLIYVGAVLFINGVMLLGWLTPPEAGPLNLFVGALQVVTPTYLIVAAAGNTAEIFAASGIYLFGFTYLWVGINALKNYRGRGFGWFASSSPCARSCTRGTVFCVKAIRVSA